MTIDELRKINRQELNDLYIKEYEAIQKDERNQQLPRPLKNNLENLFVLRHQFFHTGYLNMYLNPDRNTDIESFLLSRRDSLKALMNTYHEYKFGTAMDDKLEPTLKKIRQLGKEMHQEMRKDVFVANLEKCSELRMELDEIFMDVFRRMDKDWGTHFTPSDELMDKEDRVAYETQAAASTLYEIRRMRTYSSLAKDMLPHTQLKQIKISIGLIDREIKQAQADYNAKQKVEGRGLRPEVEQALVKLSAARHLFHTSLCNRSFVCPYEPNDAVDTLRECMETLATHTEDKDGLKGSLPINIDLDGYMDQMHQIGQRAKDNRFNEPVLTTSLCDFCDVKDQLDQKIRDYMAETDRVFGTKIAPKCQRRDSLDTVAVMRENVMNIVSMERARARRQEQELAK